MYEFSLFFDTLALRRLSLRVKLVSDTIFFSIRMIINRGLYRE
jgi:hypothetical protein